MRDALPAPIRLLWLFKYSIRRALDFVNCKINFFNFLIDFINLRVLHNVKNGQPVDASTCPLAGLLWG